MDLSRHKESAADVIREALPMTWLRGRASYHARGRWIRLDPSATEEYQLPVAVLDLPVALARIDGREAALEFVERYGLLSVGPGAHGRLQEPLDDFLETGGSMQRLLAVWAGLRHHERDDSGSRDPSTADVDALFEETLQQVRREPAIAQILGPEARNRVELVSQVGRLVGLVVTAGMTGTSEALIPVEGAPDAFAIGVRAPDLRARAFRELANVFVGYREVRFCRACGGAFLPEDPRQVFCSRRCQGRFNQAERRGRIARQEAING
jgi:hypothetical protein